MHAIKNVRKFTALSLIVGIALTGCASASGADDSVAEDDIQTLRVGLAPAEDSATVITKFTPFMDYLEETTGYEVEPYVGADYTAVIESLNSGHLDVAWFGPSEYILATNAVEGGVEAFAAAQQDEATQAYRTSFIVRADSDIDGPEDFAGQTVAFTDPASTSGHVFGRYSLVEDGYDPDEEFGQIVYSGGHDASLLSVVNEQVDIAAVSARLLPEFFEAGMASEGDIKTVYESVEIPADALTYRADLPDSAKKKIADAVLEHPEDTKAALDGTGFQGFTNANDASYDIVREAFKVADLEPEL